MTGGRSWSCRAKRRACAFPEIGRVERARRHRPRFRSGNGRRARARGHRGDDGRRAPGHRGRCFGHSRGPDRGRRPDHHAGRALPGPGHGGRRGPPGPARPRQHPHSRSHDALSRHRRRHGADGLAPEPHLAGREPQRHPRVRDLGDAPRGLGDDPLGNHHLRRHVLLRRPGGGGNEGSRAPRRLRVYRHRFPGAGLEERRRGPGRGGGVPEEVGERFPDRPRGRSPRALFRLARQPEARAGARRPLRRAPRHPRGGVAERDEDDPRALLPLLDRPSGWAGNPGAAHASGPRGVALGRGHRHREGP